MRLNYKITKALWSLSLLLILMIALSHPSVSQDNRQKSLGPTLAGEQVSLPAGTMFVTSSNCGLSCYLSPIRRHVSTCLNMTKLCDSVNLDLSVNLPIHV